jgi:hypothetical protein
VRDHGHLRDGMSPQEARGSDDDGKIAFSVITITCKTAEVSLSGSGFFSELSQSKLELKP